jgi:hypothetical protein
MPTVVPFFGGPKYWHDTYGIDSEGEFIDQANVELAKGIPPWLHLQSPITSAVLAETYQHPFGALGEYLSVAFTADSIGMELHKAGPFALNSPGSSPENPENAVSTLIIPNCYQVSINATVGGRAVTNVIGVTNPVGSAAQAAITVKAAWEDASGPIQLLPQAYQMVDYKATDIGSSTGTIHVEPSTTHGGATVGVAPATRAASALIAWNGSSRSRSTRGRMYYGPLTEDQVGPDGATLVAGAVTDIENAFSDFLLVLQSDGYPLVVLSRKNSAYTLVSDVAVEATIATQRRRIRS